MNMTASPLSFRDHLKEAREAYKGRDFPRCVTAAQAALAQKPEDENALNLLARALNKQERWADAVPQWRALARVAAHKGKYHFQAGRLELRLGQPEEARHHLIEATRLDPDHGPSWANLAVAHQRVGDWVAAAETWAKAERLPDPPKGAAQKRMAAIGHVTDPEVAEGLWLDLLNEQSEQKEAISLVLDRKIRLGRQAHKVAREAMNKSGVWWKVLDWNPHDQEALRSLIALAPQASEEAVRLTRQLSDALPEDPEVTRQWVRTLLALESRDPIMARHHNDPWILYQRAKKDPEATRAAARLASRMGDWTDAADLWRHLHDNDPKDGEALRRWARSLTKAKAPNAREAWRQVLSGSPDDTEALNAVLALAPRGSMEAVEVARQLADAQPNDPIAIRQWVRAVFAANGNNTSFPLSREDRRTLYGRATLDSEATRIAARLASHLKDWQEAADLWRMSHEHDPSDGEALSRWARSLTKAGSKEAESAWRAVLERFPEDREAAQALISLYPRGSAEAITLARRISDFRPLDPIASRQWVRAVFAGNTHGTAPLLSAACESTLFERAKNDPEATRVAARLAVHQGDWVNAADLWHHLYQTTPSDTEAVVRWARCATKVGSDQGKIAWRAVLDARPEDLEALRALIALAPRGSDEETDLCRRMARAHPRDPAAIRQWIRAVFAADEMGRPQTLAENDRTEFFRWAKLDLEAARVAARLATRQGDWKHAADLWAHLHQHDPSDREALHRWARAQARANPSSAADSWRTVLAHNPDDPEALRALLALAPYGSREAIAPAHQLSNAYPDDPGAARQWVRAVFSAVRTGSIASLSVTDREALFERVKIDPEATRIAARLAMRQRDWHSAADLWHHLSRLDPEDREALALRARCLSKSHDPNALIAWKEVLADDPDNQEALILLARSSRATNDLDEALRLWNRLRARAPDRVEPPLQIARIHLTRGDESAARPALEAVLNLDPSHFEATIHLARIHLTRDELAQSLALWERLCELKPNQVDAWRNRVRLLARMGRAKPIPDILDRADQALGDDFKALLGRADIALIAQHFDRAEALFGEAVARAPNDGQALKALGLLQWRRGALHEALPTLRAAREIRPVDPEIVAPLVDMIRTLEAVTEDVACWCSPSPPARSVQIPDILFQKAVDLAESRGRPAEDDTDTKERVVLVTGSLGPGGAERQLVAMAIGLQEHCKEVSKVTVLVRSLDDHVRFSFFLPHLVDAGIQVLTYGDFPTTDENTTFFQNSSDEEEGRRLLSCFPDVMGTRLLTLHDLLASLRPTIVHAWQDTTAIEAATAAILAGIPRILLSARSLRPDSKRRLVPHLAPAYQALLRLPWVRLTNNSQAGLDDYMDWLGLTLTCPVTPNGLDGDGLRARLDPSRSAQLRADLQIPTDAPVVGGVMRFTEEKRPLLWLDTMARVAEARPEAHFILLGDGPMRPEAEERLETLGLSGRAHLVGNDRQVAPWFGAMDLLLLTSRVEGCPNVLLEAQAVGLPVVAPAVGGAPETVDHGRSGWIVDAQAPDLAGALAERCLFCLNEGEWRAAAARSGPAFIEDRFGLAAALRATLHAYRAPFLDGA